MAYDPAHPELATPSEVATYAAAQLSTMLATSQLNADAFTRLYGIAISSSGTSDEVAARVDEAMEQVVQVAQLNADILTDFSALRTEMQKVMAEGGQPEEPPEEPVITTVTIADEFGTEITTDITVEAGTDVQLTGVVRDNFGNLVEGATLDWDSSNPAAATIDSNGLLTPVGAGSTTITLAVGDVEDTSPVAVVVTVTVASISLSATSLTGSAGGVVGTVTATARTAGGAAVPGQTFLAESSNEAAATVAVNGSSIVVTGVAAGSATITVSVGLIEATITVTVNAVDTTWPQLRAGMTQHFALQTCDALPFAGWAASPTGGGWSIRNAASSAPPPAEALAFSSSWLGLRIAAGHTGGTGFPDQQTPDIRALNDREFFIGHYFVAGTNMVGGGSGVQKLWHIWISSTGSSFSNIAVCGLFWQASQNRWTFRISMQPGPGQTGSPVRANNVGSPATNFGVCTLGALYRLQIYIKLNSAPGVYDGVFEYTVTKVSDGSQVQQAWSDVRWTDVANPKIYYATLDPTYMSTGFNAPSAMDLFFDNIQTFSQ